MKRTIRYDELKGMLESRRRELAGEVRGGVREIRIKGDREPEVHDFGESSEMDVQEDIQITLVEMKANTLAKLDDALRRLDEGSYGNCFACGEEITVPRLRALPFAVRCKDCEERYEATEQRERTPSQRRFLGPLFENVG